MAYKFEVDGLYFRVTDTTYNDVLINEVRDSIKWTLTDGLYAFLYKESIPARADFSPEMFLIGSMAFDFTDIEDSGGSPFVSETALRQWLSAHVGFICCEDVHPVTICLAASDETTALTTGAGKMTFRMPHAMTLTAVRASLTTAQTSGSIFTVDINENGSSILSTKLTIDNTEKTSTTAATAPVISDTSLADDAEITIDIDQIGDGTAKGLKIYLIGVRP